MSDPTPRRRGWSHHLHANRFVRRPLLFLTGVAVAFAVAAVIQPRWQDLCLGFQADATPCAPISVGLMFGYLTIALGVLTVIFGPIINSFYRLYRYGQVWETSRVETATGNVPIIVGLIYVVLGFAIAATVS